MKVLIIEDEIDLQEIIQQSLQKESYRVEAASTFDEAWAKIAAFDYDCILLDIMLPGGSGLDLLRKLKEWNKADNVIIISAKDSVEDKIEGLNIGADDYLAKPFHIAELNARIKSVLRRKQWSGKNFMEFGDVRLDLDERRVWIGANEVALNRKEFDILQYLMANQNRLVNKSALAEHVWGDYMDEADDFDFMYSQIKNLRKKLRDQGSAVEIQAVYGVGYKLVQQ